MPAWSRSSIASSGQTVDLDVIDLLDVRRGIEHVLRPARVVGQEQQTLARLIESSHGRDERQIEPFQAVVDRGPLLRIIAGRDQATRLVEHQIDLALGHDRLIIDGDAGASGIDTGRHVADRPAVDAHAPLRDQGFGLRAGAESELRQGARQTDHGAVSTPCSSRAPQSGHWFHDDAGPDVSW
jgi:hypothetical protein